MKENITNNILFVQDSSPCIRTIKMATALYDKGLRIYLVHRNRTPDEAYGYGNSSFSSISKLPKYRFKDIRFIKQLIIKYNIDLIHFHNFPDGLGAKLIRANLQIPIVYDQHDFFSGKKKLSRPKLSYEKICNEENSGAIYITENYRNLVAQKYQINPHNIVFPNYGLSSLLLAKDNFLPKLSEKDNKIHLVYVGLITQHKNKVRNMIEHFKKLSEQGFIIHVYSTRNKEYLEYCKIPNLVMHNKLPINELIKEISQYNFGITFLNNNFENTKILNEIKYGFWNKMYDYLMAGIPVLTLDFFEDMANFIKENEFGISVDEITDIKIKLLKEIDLNKINNSILKNREKWTVENQINRIVKFYKRTLENYHNGKT